jgi:hypothetical protein
MICTGYLIVVGGDLKESRTNWTEKSLEKFKVQTKKLHLESQRMERFFLISSNSLNIKYNIMNCN